MFIIFLLLLQTFFIAALLAMQYEKALVCTLLVQLSFHLLDYRVSIMSDLDVPLVIKGSSGMFFYSVYFYILCRGYFLVLLISMLSL